MRGDPSRRSAAGAGVVDLIPALEDWVTLPDAAGQLGISRSMIYYLVFEAQHFDFARDLRKLRAGAARPIFLLSRDALQRESTRRGLTGQSR